jgi:hypothetical protein
MAVLENSIVVFPENISVNRYISFDFYTDNTLGSTVKALEQVVTKSAQALANLNSTSSDKLLEVGGNVISSGTQLFKDIGSEINNRTQTGKLDSNKDTKSKSTWIGAIGLPLPNTLDETLNHDWNSQNGMVSQVLNMGIGPDSMSQKVVNGLAGLMGARNITVNPDYIQMYQGSQPRELSFAWTLLPNNKDEAKAIFAIIRRFKGYSSGVPTTSRAFLLAPPFCEVFISNENMDESLKINNMIIKNVSINYSEGQFMEMFYDGSPKAIVLTISLIERTLKYGSEWLIDDEKSYYEAQMSKSGKKG